ncbi:MAG: MBL fold metallo-hydrolase RNA specificity domain-containing protein, partial [Anaerolineae bacterium]
KDAYLLAAMRLAEPASVPDLGQEPWLAVYDDPKGQQYKWEQITRQMYAGSLLGPGEVKAHPGDYILAFSLWDMADLLDVEHILGEAPGGAYIYSNSKAYDEEQKVDLVRLWNWTRHFGMEPVGLAVVARDRTGRVVEVDVVPGYHASGHANGPELLQLVKTVRPKVLIPIHTEQPQWWVEELAGTGIQVEMPVYARPIYLG